MRSAFVAGLLFYLLKTNMKNSIRFPVALIIALTSIAGQAQRSSERIVPLRDKAFRVAVLSYVQETCTFCPDPAGLDAWLGAGQPTNRLLRGGDGDGYISGFEERMVAYGGVEIVGITSPAGMPVGGSSRSWNSWESWVYFTDLMKKDLKEKGPFNGVHLALHGAMAVVGVARPEAELAKMVRAVCGPDCIITVSLDLHACVDAELTGPGAANAVFSVKRFPHYDTALMGQYAADVMIRSMMGTYKPVVAVRKPGVITPSFFQGTARYPAKEIMERARIWESRAKDVYVSVNFGFAYADVPDNGASIFVVTNGDQELADEIADDMNKFYWDHRKDFVFKEIFDTESGVNHALEAVADKRLPVVIADGCDRTGGATYITNELIRRGASNFCIGTLTDPEFIDMIRSKQLKVGDHTGAVKVGGTTDIFSGDPVKLDDAVIEFANNSSVVLLFGNNNRIVVSRTLVQVTDPGWHARFGIDFSKLDIVVHKTRVHFFRGYYETGIAGDNYTGTIVKIEVPSWGPADVTKIKYVNGGQYLYPLDMNREMGHVWDRPYITEKDMIFQTGEGLVLRK